MLTSTPSPFPGALLHFHGQSVEPQRASKRYCIIWPVNFTYPSLSVPSVTTVMPLFVPQTFTENPSCTRHCCVSRETSMNKETETCDLMKFPFWCGTDRPQIKVNFIAHGNVINQGGVQDNSKEADKILWGTEVNFKSGIPMCTCWKGAVWANTRGSQKNVGIYL